MAKNIVVSNVTTAQFPWLDKQNESISKGIDTHHFYIQDFLQKSISRFEWVNFPSEIDIRYVEYMLYYYGTCAVAYIESEGKFIAGTYAINKPLNLYQNPTDFQIYTITGHTYQCSIDGAVGDLGIILWNNSSRLNSHSICDMFARRLAKIDAQIDNQVFYQGLPPVLEGTEEQAKVLTHYYQMAQRNEPVVLAISGNDLQQTRSAILENNIPYSANEMFETKKSIQQELDTYLGISPEFMQRVNVEQSETLQERVEINRLSYLNPRREFCKYFNAAFQKDVDVFWAKDNESAQHFLEVNPLEFPEANKGVLNNAISESKF